MQEKRIYQRYEIFVTVSYKQLGVKKTIIGTLLPFSNKGKTINISGGGFLFHCREKIEPNTKIEVNFSLPETGIEIKGAAKVVWINQKGNKFFTGAEFIHLNIEGDDTVELTLKKINRALVEKTKCKILQKLLEEEFTAQ